MTRCKDCEWWGGLGERWNLCLHKLHYLDRGGDEREFPGYDECHPASTIISAQGDTDEDYVTAEWLTGPDFGCVHGEQK